MIKIFFEYKHDLPGYWNMTPKSDCPKKGLLYLFYLSLNPMNEWIVVESIDDKIIIWTDFFEEEGDSRQDVSKLELSKENYNKVLELWNNNLKNRAPYLVLSQNDFGWINLEGKQELSQDDLDYVENEKSKNK